MANSYVERNMTGDTASTKMTFSCWLKKSNPSTDGRVFGAQALACHAYWLSSGELRVDFSQKDSGSTVAALKTNKKFRDVNAWYHIVFALDTTLATADDRIKLWVNGVQETSFAVRTNASQNVTFAYGQSGYYTVGARTSNQGGAGHYFDGYIAHAAYVDGAALTPTSFGQTDATSGIWKFKNPTGITWGTNGFHLKFENSGAMGTDSSGNSNTFTVNGNLKQALDTPSNVYSTLNALATSSYSSLTQGNNTVKGNTNTNDGETYSTLGTGNKGKWYWEIKATGTNGNGNPKLGFVQSNRTSVMRLQNGGSGYGGAENGSLDIMTRPDGKVTENGSTSSVLYNSFSAGNILSYALDCDNGAFYYAINGTWQNSGNPASGASRTGAIKTWTPTDEKASGGQHVCIGSYENSTQADCNFGNGFFGTTAITSAGSNGNGSLFEYDVPSGYYALNTKNLNTYG